MIATILATACITAPKQLYLSSFSYTVPNPKLMWSVDDFLVKDKGGERPWHNLLVVTGNDTDFAQLSSLVLHRTNHSLPILWNFDQRHWKDDAAITKSNFEAFLARYDQLRQQHPHLPRQPFGVYMGDEPHMLNVTKQRLLSSTLKMVRTRLPDAVTYMNLLFASIACPDPAYCCCQNMSRQPGYSNATELATALGAMELDLISSDEYYDVSLQHYRKIYEQNLYPFLRPAQKVLLVPFAAYCEIGCKVNSTIGGPGCASADARLLSTAKAHHDWAAADDRVAGLIVYRLKNLWQQQPGMDACRNPYGIGLGVVDRCGVDEQGGYATPTTLAYYQQLLAPSL
jgi:hypothetical protein